jgi:hypothetical protein
MHADRGERDTHQNRGEGGARERDDNKPSRSAENRKTRKGGLERRDGAECFEDSPGDAHPSLLNPGPPQRTTSDTSNNDIQTNTPDTLPHCHQGAAVLLCHHSNLLIMPVLSVILHCPLCPDLSFFPYFCHLLFLCADG